MKTFHGLLSTDEQQRASRFHFQRDRNHFVLARGILRTILSRYLNVSPDQIVFSFSEYGKPALSLEMDDRTLRFNVTHSHDIALYAVTRGREIGIDIELVREDFASLEIAEHFFSPTEVSMLYSLPHASRAKAFFDCWTRKEAYIKARGEGLSYPLHKFTVSLDPQSPTGLLSVDDDPSQAARWTLVELLAGQGYRAALAVEGNPPVLRCWQWQ